EQTGEYLLVDERKEASESLSGNAGDRRYVARVIIAGKPHPMNLPKDEQLRGFRLKPIDAAEVTGKQEAKFAIKLNPVEFLITEKTYDPANPRILRLNAVEEWTVWSAPASDPRVFPLPHPFHMHVNPIEVFSITDENGKETLAEPVWRDT